MWVIWISYASDLNQLHFIDGLESASLQCVIEVSPTPTSNSLSENEQNQLLTKISPIFPTPSNAVLSMNRIVRTIPVISSHCKPFYTSIPHRLFSRRKRGRT